MPIAALTRTQLSMTRCEVSSESDHEEAILRRRFDNFTAKGIALLIPIVLAISGWAFSLQGRIHEIATQQSERGPRIDAMEKKLALVAEAVRDPSPKPETRVEMKAMDDRLARIEERVNYIHNYLMALPVRPAPVAAPLPGRRGDLRLEDIIKSGADSRLN